MRKLYMGYDLGDGETIINYVIKDTSDFSNDQMGQVINDVKMPGKKEFGKALPTIFAYHNNEIVFFSQIEEGDGDISNIHSNFKRRPTDLINTVNGKMKELFGNNETDWLSDLLVSNHDLLDYSDCVVTFTNSIFENEEFQDKIKFNMEAEGGVEEIVICAGHPTNWSEDDCLIYKKVLMQSILGQTTYLGIPLKLVIAGESRAAFLYIRETSKDRSKFQNMALLLDVGSSTTDVTAIKNGEKTSAYNSGHNYLGARIIDYFILEWYLQKLKEKDEYEEYKEIIVANPTAQNALLLSCRMAKEKIYGTGIDTAKISFADFKSIKLSRTDLETFIDTLPISHILETYLNGTPEQLKETGSRSWREEFMVFLERQKVIMAGKNYQIESIILTGSASQMPVVKEVASEVFGISVYFDDDPSKTISKGLALVGWSNDKSAAFQIDAKKMIEEEIPKTIENDIQNFAERLSEYVTDMICDDIVLPHLLEWKSGEYITIRETMDIIKDECSEEELSDRIKNSTACQGIITDWMFNVVGKDIAYELQKLCEKYHVTDFSVEGLNVFNMNLKGDFIGNSFDGIGANDLLSPADLLVNIVSIISGILVFSVMPTLVSAITVILLIFTDTLGLIVLEILLAVPGIGWTILVGIAGFAAAKAVKGQLNGMKEKISKKLVDADIPASGRALVSEGKIKKSVSKQKKNIYSKIEESILAEESKQEIKASICKMLEKQIVKKIEEIKYIIETK